MHRILPLMMLLTTAYAPSSFIIEPVISLEVKSTMPSLFKSSTMPNRNDIKTTSRRKMKQGKIDSPMLNYIFDSYATSNKHFHDKFKSPSFEDSLTADDSVLEADTGATVFFDCRVASLRDKMVSWIKVSEEDKIELLTLDLDTHTADSRFRVDLSGDNWRLELSQARVQDSGIYCCHVSTHPPLLRRVKLTVKSPQINLPKEAFLETGETLSLKCSVKNLFAVKSEPNLHWFRGNDTSSLDEVRGGVMIETDHVTVTSHLQVANLRMEDAGNYTCLMASPMQLKATTRVHVLQGSSLAELQSGTKSLISNNRHLILPITLIVLTMFCEMMFDIR